ncbi:hypothetical protein [Lacticaseibacillus nasuensis]|nr:hypothetical protein [Lacticaseibacillus nasuensis]
MYAVKNKDDKLFVVRSNDNAYLYQDQYGDLGRVLYRYYSRKDAQRAIERAGHINQCHVVELVEKPKRFVLPMEGTELPDGTVAYAVLDQTGAWTVKGYAEEQSAITFGSTVTQANIDSAPDWVKAITPVEVTDNGEEN